MVVVLQHCACDARVKLGEAVGGVGRVARLKACRRVSFTTLRQSTGMRATFPPNDRILLIV